MHLLLSSIFLLNASFAAAWGRVGHEIVGNLAWELLPEDIQANVASMLIRGDGSYGNDNCTACSPLGMVADWADTVRRSHNYSWTGPLHYVDVRDDLVAGGCPVISESDANTSACHFQYERDCVDDFCAVGALANYTALSVKETDAFLRRDALMFLTHFMGDLHQPLHVSRTTDRGGNSIHVVYSVNGTAYKGRHLRGNMMSHHHRSLNLHAVWDDTIIETALEQNYQSSRSIMERSLLENIKFAMQTGEYDTWLDCPDGAQISCGTKWAAESFTLALRWAYRDVDGSEVVNGSVLGNAYYESRLHVVKRQLSIAAVRLASTLKIAFSTVV